MRERGVIHQCEHYCVVIVGKGRFRPFPSHETKNDSYCRKDGEGDEGAVDKIGLWMADIG